MTHAAAGAEHKEDPPTKAGRAQERTRAPTGRPQGDHSRSHVFQHNLPYKPAGSVAAAGLTHLAGWGVWCWPGEAPLPLGSAKRVMTWLAASCSTFRRSASFAFHEAASSASASCGTAGMVA